MAVPELKPSRGRRHNGIRVMGRIIHLTRAGRHSIQEAAEKCAAELATNWGGATLQPKNAASKMVNDFARLKSLRKTCGAAPSSLGRQLAEDFNLKMSEGYNISAKDTQKTKAAVSKGGAMLKRAIPPHVLQAPAPKRMSFMRAAAHIEDLSPCLSTMSSEEPSPYLPTALKKKLEEEKECAPSVFPGIDTRSGQKTIDEKLARAFSICQSGHRVSADDLRCIFVKVANIVFDQEWVLMADEEQDNAAETSGLCKVLPSRRTFGRWLKSAAILSLKHLATAVIEKEDGEVITCGFDDGLKSAGHKTFDVKAMAFHVTKPGQDRRTMSAGFIGNASHSAEDAAKQLNVVFKCIATVAGATLQDTKVHLLLLLLRSSGITDPNPGPNPNPNPNPNPRI